jgi:hypothetical protein
MTSVLTSGVEPSRRIASVTMTTAMTIRTSALASAARTSARW